MGVLKHGDELLIYKECWMNRGVWILAIAGALGLCVAPVVVFIGGIVGANLAPQVELATLPVAFMVVGTALSVLPVTRFMQLFGRKRVFISGAIFSAMSAFLASYFISVNDFWGFTLAVSMLGAGMAIIQQYRFAAMESVSVERMASAASFVLLGGLVAAILGPELAQVGENLFETAFSGSFFLLAFVCLAGGFCLLFYQTVEVPQAENAAHAIKAERSLRVIMRAPVFWVAVLAAAIGYAVMSYIMTATPVSMHVMEGHSLNDTKWVIQSHIFAMFLPSFFSGRLIDRFGATWLMIAGLFLYVICIVIALAGQQVMHYWGGLIMLGVGWNFLFVSGTVLLPQSYESKERFKVQGFNDFFVFGLQAFASLSSGAIIYNFGWENLVLIALPFLLLQLLAMYIWHAGKLKRQGQSNAI
jgi:MFS family permease